MLVEEGLCKVLPQAERLTFGKSLFDAEEKAREAKKNIWEVSLECLSKSTVSYFKKDCTYQPGMSTHSWALEVFVK